MKVNKYLDITKTSEIQPTNTVKFERFEKND